MIEDLLDQFVCVRMVQANTLDLTLFQFDYDLTFAVLFMNADRTIYGRFGSRSGRDEQQDMTLEGFRQSLAAALHLHRAYPANRVSLQGKQPRPTPQKTPDDYPSLRGKYQAELDYTGNVARSCLHCHQVREAERVLYRTGERPVPAQVLYPYPMPDTLGLSLDPQQRATVARIAPGSPAASSRLRPGDEILTLDGQPILSTADVQWVLHHAGEQGPLEMLVRRGEKRGRLTLELGNGWRRQTDISWRVSSWDLRRMAVGGLVLEEPTAEQRRANELDETALALRVKHVGQWGQHAAAKRAGFQQGDILVAFDGRRQRMTESQLLAYVLQHQPAGRQVPVTVLRKGRQLELQLPMQ